MKQKQYAPLSVAEMSVSLYAVNEGYLDKVPADKVVAYEAALHAHAHSTNQALLDKIDEVGELNDEIAAGLRALLDSFTATGAY
jgi:F-type H+-transporting ATPase subunit alpha